VPYKKVSSKFEHIKTLRQQIANESGKRKEAERKLAQVRASIEQSQK